MDVRAAYVSRGRPLFCTLQGGEIQQQYVRNLLRRIRAKAGVDKRVHPHGFRHTHAAELVQEHAPMTVIRDQLGHTSLATTDRYLRGIAPEQVIDFGRNRNWEAK
jgi:site-specific recombinase XerD